MFKLSLFVYIYTISNSFGNSLYKAPSFFINKQFYNIYLFNYQSVIIKLFVIDYTNSYVCNKYPSGGVMLVIKSNLLLQLQLHALSYAYLNYQIEKNAKDTIYTDMVFLLSVSLNVQSMLKNLKMLFYTVCTYMVVHQNVFSYELSLMMIEKTDEHRLGNEMVSLQNEFQTKKK